MSGTCTASPKVTYHLVIVQIERPLKLGSPYMESIRTNMQGDMHIYIYIFTHMYMCKSTYIYIYTHICIYIYIYVYMYMFI